MLDDEIIIIKLFKSTWVNMLNLRSRSWDWDNLIKN